MKIKIILLVARRITKIQNDHTNNKNILINNQTIVKNRNIIIYCSIHSDIISRQSKKKVKNIKNILIFSFL